MSVRSGCRGGVLAAGVLVLLASVASATTIEDFTFGATWWGDEYKPEELKGRVVVVDFWGRH